MSRQYTTIAKVQDYLGYGDSDYSTSKIDVWITDMTKYIEEETNRVFEADTEASEKIYEIIKDNDVEIGRYKVSPRKLVVNEFMEGTNKLTIDDDEIDADDYYFYPLNESPKTTIILTDDSGLYFTEDEKNIKFEACWGYSEEPPQQIEFACIVLVAGIILNSVSHEGELASVNIGRYSATYKTEKQVKDFENVQAILEKYTKINL